MRPPGASVTTSAAGSWGDQGCQGRQEEHSKASAIYQGLWKYFSISSAGRVVHIGNYQLSMYLCVFLCTTAKIHVCMKYKIPLSLHFIHSHILKLPGVLRQVFRFLKNVSSPGKTL